MATIPSLRRRLPTWLARARRAAAAVEAAIKGRAARKGDVQGARSEEIADIALLLEGTYPFVRGGVSSWVHQIVSSLKEVRFAIIFLGASPESCRKRHYELPKNVLWLESRFLGVPGRVLPPRARRGPGSGTALAAVPRLLEWLKSSALHPDDALLQRLIDRLGEPDGLRREDFLYSEAAWKIVCASYRRWSIDPSFLDYFWTVRSMHAPLFTLADIARSAPPARAYHAVSTGYAGFLGALLQRRHGRPYILTEHGIYTKERKIDLAQADWIRDGVEPFSGSLAGGLSHVRQLWIRFFEGLGRLAYSAADPIIALYEGNRRRQVADGADPERTRVIPNGVDLKRLAPLRPLRPPSPPPVIGLIGRVVPIKDIKCFILMMRAVCSRLPAAQGWIIGPEDEDPDYAKDCHEAVSALGLEGRVRFLGFQKVDDILPKLGLLALTSISEALPLVILEGYAAGLPALATDVGSCRELIEGASPADRALGAAGAVADIADPEALAAAAVALLSDPGRWQAAQRAAISRVERYYTLEMMEESYRSIYRRALEECPR